MCLLNFNCDNVSPIKIKISLYISQKEKNTLINFFKKNNQNFFKKRKKIKFKKKKNYLKIIFKQIIFNLKNTTFFK
jgi:hypothetical protein